MIIFLAATIRRFPQIWLVRPGMLSLQAALLGPWIGARKTRDLTGEKGAEMD